jgi:Domain of unknown function (DUF6285)
MPNSYPDAVTMLGAAVKYLEDELLPTLDGYHRFKTRVTINVLAMIKRELEMREGQAAAERERLTAILGHGGEVEELSSELADKIKSGAVSSDDAALRAHIRHILADALAINNPKWMTR